jgi:hypothetical protein
VNGPINRLDRFVNWLRIWVDGRLRRQHHGDRSQATDVVEWLRTIGAESADNLRRG